MTFKNDVSDADKQNAKVFFEAFDAAVRKARNYAVTVPSLGALVNVDGYTKRWGTLWADFLAGNRPKMMAAAFGYVIESLVSGTPEFSPTPPAGCVVVPQVTSGGTRPDLVLRLIKGGADVAWLDLTASGSVGHIYEKDDWAKKIGIFAEVTYESLDPGTLAFMVQNKDNQGELSEEEFKRRADVAKAEHARHQIHWEIMGSESYTVRAQKAKYGKEGMGRTLASISSGDGRTIAPHRMRDFIKHELELGFKATIGDEKMVPSILRALGVNPVTWEFGTGYSESRVAGEAWLVNHDTTLPSSSEPAGLSGAGTGDRRHVGGGRDKKEKVSARTRPY